MVAPGTSICGNVSTMPTTSFVFEFFIFNSIMCVVIGGVLLTGGAGSIIGIVLGTMTFAVVNQGIFFASLDPNIGSIIIGLLLLAAVLSNDTFRALAMSAAANVAIYRYGPKNKSWTFIGNDRDQDGRILVLPQTRLPPDQPGRRRCLEPRCRVTDL